MISLLFPLFLAFSYRSRGMQHTWNDTVNRIISWAIPVGFFCTCIAYIHHFPLWAGLLCSLTAFIGACIGHSSEQSDTFLAHFEMGVITTVMLLLIIAPLAWFEPKFLFITPLGYLGSIAYWLGYKYPFNLTLFGIKWVTAGDASAGELWTGALAFGLPLAIIANM